VTRWTGLAPFEDDVSSLVCRSNPSRPGVPTARQRLQACLDRIDEHEERINAWVAIDRARAFETADWLDRQPVGCVARPMRGAVIAVKDIVDVAGMQTRLGVWPESLAPASQDASIVASLRAAGAIILGKTVTTAHAWIDPPPTRNPWNIERTPGGSSSGSAAAVALGMCEAAIGTQTGGSIIRPAAFCGVYGLKPGYGTLPTDGISELARSLDHPGFLARSVFDLSVLFASVIGSNRLVDRPIRPRIGRVRTPFEERASAQMNAAMDRACAKWEAAGASITELNVSYLLEDVHKWHFQIMASEAAFLHHGHPDALGEEIYPPRIRELISNGNQVSATNYLIAKDRQANWNDRCNVDFDQIDVLVLPSASGEAPDSSTTGDPYFNSPWSFFGLPVLGIPVAGPPDCLPLGAQLVGKPGSDVGRSLFRYGMWCEAVLRGEEPDRRTWH
jgi:Asp-tRNA(Asn)/Glu-tRNA(Gln) amidotransferase A subunit family amidase